jgi:hypothetical protein
VLDVVKQQANGEEVAVGVGIAEHARVQLVVAALTIQQDMPLSSFLSHAPYFRAPTGDRQVKNTASLREIRTYENTTVQALPARKFPIVRCKTITFFPD